jgi:hypothetical protein
MGTRVHGCTIDGGPGIDTAVNGEFVINVP